MALAEYTPQPHKFNRFNKNGLFGRDRVNQNQTYRYEVQGGYLWSPKRNANGARNPFYESMREVAPGDLIFSFADTRILAVGIAQSYCWESPKPEEFGNAGQNWEDIGWKVKISFTELGNKARPKDHIEVLRPLLPDRYSPLQPNGNGIQSVYLTELPTTLAEVLIGLIGREVAPISLAARDVKPVPADDLDIWDRRLEQQIVNDSTVRETDRLAIIRARSVCFAKILSAGEFNRIQRCRPQAKCGRTIA